MRTGNSPLDHETTRQQARVLSLTEAELEELLDGAKQRKNAHVGQLMRLFGDRLHEKLRRMNRDASDTEVAEVVSDTFMALPRLLKSYEEQGRFEGWLLEVARNIASTKLRSRIRHQAHYGDAVHDPVRDPSAIAKLEEAELLGRMASQLSPSLRDVWALHLEGRSPDEICALLHLSTGAVHTRLHRARKRLLESIGIDQLREWLGASRLLELLGEKVIKELFGEDRLSELKRS